MEWLGASARAARTERLPEAKNSSNRSPKLFDQLWIHEFVFIRYVENVDRLVLKRSRMLCQEARLVFLFHDEDDFTPLKVRFRDAVPGARTRSR